MTALDDYSLSDRLAAESGTVAMSGIQALMRVPLDQVRADARKALRIAGLICGYRGSPVGGMDQAYEADREILEAHHIRFISGVNEDLGATAVWGSQQASLEASASFDGVLGMWYGKGPGVDRSGDALRHANTSGVAKNGGVLAVAGDDPSCKSSTIASASEWALADLAMPTLYPGTVQEVLDFGRVGYEMSRFSGAWTGFKIVTNVADGFATVDPDPERLTIMPVEFEVDGKPWEHEQNNLLLAPYSVQLEAEVFGPRLEAAKAFIAGQNLDRTVGAPAGAAKIGIVAAGTGYGEVRDALATLGIASDDDLARLGIRIYKPAMIWPLEPTALGEFAAGLEEIMVVEEKRAFVESQIRDILYGTVTGPDGRPPRVLGKSDDEGRPLVPHFGGLVSEDLVEPLRRRLSRFVGPDDLRKPRTRIPVSIASPGATSDADVEITAADMPNRTAHFCSGCPHNRSTLVPDGSRALGGIGCHGMALNMDRENHGITHMGGEGVQWVGAAPFVDDDHRFQNLGDGTFAHSGSLAIRQAVSAGTNITYKILYNGTVAMTGGQDAAGQMTVPELTRALEAEGASQIVVVADDVKKYPSGSVFAKSSRIEHRDELDAVQRELRDVEGVTVIVYDQACAAELRRGRKRGTIVTPTTRVMIDESICEGCGDCGEVSNCASVHPIQTPFGRKTMIHQESCNFDLTCLKGNCPAFVTVEIDPDFKPSKAAAAGIPDGDLPADPTVPDAANVLLIGIGGTGVVTVSQIISTAALLDGKESNGLDQTGLAQKGGSVVSNLRIADTSGDASNRVGTADALLCFDLLTATSNLDRTDVDATTAIVSSGLVPTGAMVSGRGAERFPELDQYRDLLNASTRGDDNVWLDAASIARAVFASQPAANVLVVGIAYQKGILPVTGASIERAIELNGVAVQTNLDAFRLGRRLAAEPALLATLGDEAATVDPTAPPLTGSLASLATGITGDLNDDAAPTLRALHDVLAWRLPELVGWENEAYARRYADDVRRIRKAEAALVGDRTDLSQAVARYLFKAMAYKDEYEVARLALGSDVAEKAKQRFGPNAKVSYMLHPPTLKSLGRKSKIAIPEVAGRKTFEGLLKTKRLRGTKLDPFGRTEERKIERELIDEYRSLIDRLIRGLDADNYDEATTIASMFDSVRGFDEVKLANVERYRSEVDEALRSFA